MIEHALLDLNARVEVFSVYVYPPLGLTKNRPYNELSRMGVLVEKEIDWQEEVFHCSFPHAYFAHCFYPQHRLIFRP